MLFRHQDQLASSLVLGWFSACVSWAAVVFLDRLISQCVFSPPLVLA